MTRKQKLLMNSGFGMLRQIITLICGFVLPRYMLMYYGSEVNGLVASITFFLNFISLLELGIGPVIQANLYKPLASKDDAKISKIVKSSNRFFRTIAVFFLFYIVVLAIVFPNTVTPDFGIGYTVSLLAIISVSTFAQYFFGMTYQLLLNADQKSYVQQIINIVTIVLNTVFAVLIMEHGGSVHKVKLASAVIFVLRPLVQNIYVNIHYNIDRNIDLMGEPIKQKWNGFSQHLASVVTGNIDVVLLTFFSTLQNVSVYNVYFLVTSGVTQIVMTAANGLEAYFGNMIANDEMRELKRTFSVIEGITHMGVIAIFSITMITICPFIMIYTRGITDADYNVPVFAFILVNAYAAQCLRIPYFRVIKAAGHFKQTQNGAFIAMAINIVISVIFVSKYGLIGVSTGTLCAMLFHTCYFVWYLKNNILCRSIIHFIKYILFDCMVVAISYIVSREIAFLGNTYFAWTIYAFKITIIVSAVLLVLSLIMFRKNIKIITSVILQKVIKKK